jgi:hypothetical protein
MLRARLDRPRVAPVTALPGESESTLLISSEAPMSTPAQSILQDLQNRLGDLMRSTPAADVERNVKAVVNQAFQKLDLVTRDELDAYAQALAALKERVGVLEQRIAALESGSANPAAAAAPSSVGGVS